MGTLGSYRDAAFSSGTPSYAVLSFVPSSSRIDNNQVYYVLVNAASNTCALGAVCISYTVTQAG
jgi:hypothetical protein